MARIFLAGASGIIGQRLVPLLVRAGHQVTGTTRTEAGSGMLRALGATLAVVDVFDAPLLARIMTEHAPEVVIHELTSLPDHMASLDAAGLERAIRANARIRTEGTPALVAAATACRACRLVAQSILWIYARGPEPHVESDPIDVGATGLAGVTVQGVKALERAVLGAPMDSVVLRHGWLYGPGSGHDGPWKDPALHVTQQPVRRSWPSIGVPGSTTSRSGARTHRARRRAASSGSTWRSGPEAGASRRKRSHPRGSRSGKCHAFRRLAEGHGATERRDPTGRVRASDPVRLRALLGAVFGAGTLARLDAKSPGWLVVASALGALAVGLLARHFGDRFWWSLRHWLWL